MRRENPLPGGKAVEVTYDKKQAALYLDLTNQETLPDELNKTQYEDVGGGLRKVTLPDTKTESERNQKNFFQPEVATGLQLSALAIDDSDFAMALQELMGAHLLSLDAKKYIEPYTLKLVYQGKRLFSGERLWVPNIKMAGSDKRQGCFIKFRIFYNHL